MAPFLFSPHCPSCEGDCADPIVLASLRRRDGIRKALHPPLQLPRLQAKNLPVQRVRR
jgi:hypothetical protein